jgi:hypothetical protein
MTAGLQDENRSARHLRSGENTDPEDNRGGLVQGRRFTGDAIRSDQASTFRKSQGRVSDLP